MNSASPGPGDLTIPFPYYRIPPRQARQNLLSMDYAGSSTALVFNLKEESPFSFHCQVCGACCSNKTIRLSPYEILRLARSLGLSTKTFLQRHTEGGKGVLCHKADGSCFFLSPSGCRVYADRPLVCRLFPLGLITDRKGGIRYASMPLHPDCLGIFDTDGTVRSYLHSQGTELYFHYDKVYAAIYKKIMKRLKPEGYPISETGSHNDPRLDDRVFSLPQALLSSWLDIDKTVAGFCRKNNRTKPQTPDETVSIHLEALKAWQSAFWGAAL